MSRRSIGIRDLLRPPIVIGAAALVLVGLALHRACTDDAPLHGGPRMGTMAVERYSELLGVSLRGDENQALLQELSTWLGTPYRGGMNQKGVGTDCSGFVQRVFAEVYGVQLGRSSGDMWPQISPLPQGELRCGHLVLFSRGGAERIFHVGIYLGDNRFIHSASGGGRGITVSSLTEDYYAKHFYSGGPVKGMKR